MQGSINEMTKRQKFCFFDFERGKDEDESEKKKDF